MFGFIGALVGGAFLGGKYLADANASRKMEDRIYARLAEESRIRSKYIPNYEKMSEIKQYAYSLTREQRNEIYAEDFEYALGENWRTKSDDRLSEWYLRLVLADRGKIDDQTLFGIHRRGGREGAIDFAFAQCVEKRLHKAGVEIDLIWQFSPQLIKIKSIAIGQICSLENRRLLHASCPENDS